MQQTKRVIKSSIRYSEAFKMQVVSELEREGLCYTEVQRKYGIRSHATVLMWVRKYGNGSRGKVIRVQNPEEIDELKRLQDRVRRLEKALADATVDLALEQEFTQLACQRAGIKDVADFKKKCGGQPGTKR